MAAPIGNKYAVGNKGGRPKKEIDWNLVEQLAEIQCTQVEIAHALGVAINTLTLKDKFREIYERSMNNGRMSLRRMQWNAAKKGNKTMLIWLGKQYLGQKDKHEFGGDKLNPLDMSMKVEFVNPEENDES